MQPLSSSTRHFGAAEPPQYPRSLRLRICHLGVGNFHRAHQAAYLHQLLQQGDARGWGICGIALMPADRKILASLQPQNGLYCLWEIDEHTRRPQVIGSIMEMVDAIDDRQPALEVLTQANTAIVSLTITEKGYCLNDEGRLDLNNPSIRADLGTPGRPQSAIGLITLALRQRRERGLPAFTVMSCDNLLENGHKARNAICDYARHSDPALAQWIESHSAFPSSMVDRITPLPRPELVRQLSAQLPFTDEAMLYCEPWRQWIIEDDFPGGRPDFEKAGVVFTDKVFQYEAMKVGLLNAGHSALCHRGLLQGFSSVHEAAASPDLTQWLRQYWHEAIEILDTVPGTSYQVYCEALLERFRNPAIDDSLWRLAEDSRAKFQQCLIPLLLKRIDRAMPVTAMSAIITEWIRFLGMLTDHRELFDRYREADKAALGELARSALASGQSELFLQYAFGSALAAVISPFVDTALRG